MEQGTKRETKSNRINRKQKMKTKNETKMKNKIEQTQRWKMNIQKSQTKKKT